MWYHDHFLDFTGPNVYKGLAGFFLVFDELDTGDETGTLFPGTNLRLPSGAFDVPLVIRTSPAMRRGICFSIPSSMMGSWVTSSW